jgi:hypothetical protein
MREGRKSQRDKGERRRKNSNSRLPLALHRLKHRVPSEVRRSPCGHNLPLRLSLEKDRFRPRSGRVGEGADGGGILGGETDEEVVETCCVKSEYVGRKKGEKKNEPSCPTSFIKCLM